MRNSGGVDSIWSFAISKELPPTQPSYLPPKPPPLEIPSMDSSLCGSSLSSTSFNQKYNEYYAGYAPATPKIDGIGSSCSSFTSQSSFEIHVSGDELFGTNSNQSSIGSNASFMSTLCRSQQLGCCHIKKIWKVQTSIALDNPPTVILVCLDLAQAF